MTSPPEPPQQLFDEPAFLDPKWDFLWPLEYAANWTGEYEQGMADYEWRLQNTLDTIAARNAWQRGDRDRARNFPRRLVALILKAAGRDLHPTPE